MSKYNTLLNNIDINCAACRRFYYYACGIHRDLFKSVVGYVTEKPVKSSVLCEDGDVR